MIQWFKLLIWERLKFSFANRECQSRSGEKQGWANSSFITHGILQITHSWLSSCDKIKIPHSRLHHSWGIFISSRLLSHSWGIWNVPWVMSKEFCSSLFLSRPGLTFPICKRKLQPFSNQQFKSLNHEIF